MTILQWMEKKGIKPYSEGNELAEAIPLAFRHLGDVATGKRPCSRWVARRLVEITNGEISYDDLFGQTPQPQAQVCQEAAA